ncbi:MAG: GNAT family N-acetyltransferase [Rhodospirillales bacterium]|jgi:GNAT superfamily N-acetyltransferase|nr:GNAT family N-acetyltransferase [Rhodospirillales bacterium]
MKKKSKLKIKKLHKVPEFIETCAQWNYLEWKEKLGFCLDDSVEWVRQVTFSTQGEFAVIAFWDETPVGMNFLERNDANERPELTPWLSGVYVTPDYRGKGIGSALIKAIEDLAYDEGYKEIYLHTPNVEEIYTKLGWQTFDEFNREKSGRHAVMRKVLI